MASLPGVRMAPVEATYLAWIDVRDLRLAKPAAHFEAHGIGLSDGADFGAPGWLRLNFGCPRATLDEALSRSSGQSGRHNAGHGCLHPQSRLPVRRAALPGADQRHQRRMLAAPRPAAPAAFHVAGLSLAGLLFALHNGYALELAVRTGLYDFRQATLSMLAGLLAAFAVHRFRRLAEQG